MGKMCLKLAKYGGSTSIHNIVSLKELKKKSYTLKSSERTTKKTAYNSDSRQFNDNNRRPKTVE